MVVWQLRGVSTAVFTPQTIMRGGERLMYALIRVLLEYIRQAQREKHTAEEILNNLRDMLTSALGR